MQEFRDVLECFYRENRTKIIACALSVTGNMDLAEDAIQDAFYKLARLNKRPDYVTTYVMRAVYHAAIDKVRQRNSNAPIEEAQWFQSNDDPKRSADQNQFQQKVETILQTINADERETVIQHLYGDLSFREIAEIRQVPIGTAASWYSRGLQKIRSKIGNDYG